MALKVLALLLFLAPAVLAHICMINPVQRGGYNINTPGENACYLKVGPCGQVPSGAPVMTIAGGSKFNIQFQQNLNHFYIENPGTLAADIAFVADPAESDFTPLGLVNDYNAMNEITQTNFTIPVTIPNVDSAHAVIRTRYISQNPTENDRGMTFYQCSDVKIEASSTASAPATPVKETKVTSSPYDCCAPKQFTMEGSEVSEWRNPTKKFYYFDAVNKLFRVDTVSGEGTTVKDGHFQMFSNFTSGIEYYYNVAAGTCDLYGLNYWSDWCYGAINNQVLAHSIPLKASETPKNLQSTSGQYFADIWALPGENDVFRWTSLRPSCMPINMGRMDSSESTIFSNYKEGAPDFANFQIPQACVRKEAEFLASKQQLQSSPHPHPLKL